MAWNWKRPDNLPISVERAVLEKGTIVAGKYYIHELFCYSGSELYYHVQDVQSGEHFWLDELLPFQWCGLDYEGNFVPHRKESAVQWEAVKNIIIERLKRLQSFSEEESIPEIQDIFEEYGTIFHTETIRQNISLHEHLEQGTLSPSEAMQLFAPVLDTLAGLHEEGISHGNITDTAIRLEDGECILRDWMNQPHATGKQDDVRAVSLLLYQAMTGESIFQDETAQKLPETIRNAVYNGIYDNNLTIMELWHQLHAKRPVKRVEPVRAVRKKASPLPWVMTIVFCTVCLWLAWNPVQTWSTNSKTGATSRKAEHLLPDVSYTEPEKSITLPELLYLPEEEALKELENLGLRGVVVKKAENPVIPKGKIVTQTPNAGNLLQKGDTVTLSVSDGWKSRVPDVSGMPLDEATEKLEKSGFIVETVEAVSDAVAPNAVISQDIAPETELERESSIQLLVSIGRKDIDTTQKVTMPDCTGMTFDEAKTILSEQFLYAVLEDMTFDKKTPAGKIISQSVESNEEIPQGTSVNFVISLGAEKTSVPDVTGMTIDEAKEALEKASLRCVLCYVSGDAESVDKILSQNYPPESVVPINAEVWLNVSVGSESRVESLGGWSGNPLPTPDGQPPIEVTPPEEENPEAENPDLEIPPEENPEITNPPLPEDE